MEERLANGEEVLIFRNISNVYEQEENDFIKGFIINSEKSDNLSYNGQPFFTWIYKVIGEDNKLYDCSNGMIIYGNDYIRRPIDYLRDIRNRYLYNLDKIKKIDNVFEIERLKDINKSYIKTLYVIKNICKKR